MCGRNSLFLDRSALEERFDARLATDGGVEYAPRFNVAPGEDLEVVTAEAPETIHRIRWGLVPSWADEGDRGFVNARAETASEKPAFRAAWERRPCLVLSTGFYEWREQGPGPTQPYRVYREGEDPAFAMAGLWERWEGDDEVMRTVTVLTTEPNDVVAPIHDRMPVVLPESAEDTWLEAGPDQREALCRPYPEDDLDAYPLSRAVNDPSNDDASVVEPADSEQSGLGDF